MTSSKNALTIFRRHVKACIKGYAPKFRIFRPQTPKEQKVDCTCPIVVDGYLMNVVPQRVQGVSTQTNIWEEAETTRALWESWGQFTDPNPTTIEDPTLTEASEKFLEHLRVVQKLEGSTVTDYNQHFRLRMMTYCMGAKVTHVRHFENASIVRECITSWRQVNGEPLGGQTQRAELERFRRFLSWCVENGWLKKNHSKAKGLSVRTAPTSKKFGWTPEESRRVFDAIPTIRSTETESDRTRAFCLVMRHTGLRISDVTKLDQSQLVTRAGGNGWAVQVMTMQKTKEYVRIPITPETYDALKALPFKGSKDGKKFWFYTGVGSLRTSVKTWRKRITLVIATANKVQPFEHHSTPHTFRHTFAISHLNEGTEIKMVSRWLGHSSVAITERHYGHANQATHLASEAAYDESMRKQAERMNGKPAANVVPIKQRRNGG